MENLLQSHLALCERIYELILEENQILKITGKAPEALFLERKRALLCQIEASLEKLRGANGIPGSRTQPERTLIDKTQQMVMKTLLLDRENEQLLLKSALSGNLPPITPKPPLGHLQRIYGKQMAAKSAVWKCG